MRRLAPLLLAAAALAAGCVYAPEGQCESSADCGAGEQCSAGVCIRPAALDNGVDPTFATTVWTRLDAKPGAAFAVDAIGADLAGNVVVAGSVDASYDFDPGQAGTGAFVVRLDPDGVSSWVKEFPAFEHDQLEIAVLPAGDVLYAGTGFDPPMAGTLEVGRLAAATGASAWMPVRIANTHATAALAPAAIAANGGTLAIVGTGSANFGAPACTTAGNTFVAVFSAATGACQWAKGLATRTISDVEVLDDGSVAIAGRCTPPAGASFDPGGGTTCTKGLFVSKLAGANGSALWARIASGAGVVEGVSDLAVAADGTVTVIGDATGVVDFGRGPVDFGTAQGSFAATWDPAGAATALVRPVETPYGPEPDAVAFSRAAYDPAGKLWIAGRYAGQPALGGVRFSPCRAPDCASAAFLAALDAAGHVQSFLPIRAGATPGGGAYLDDVVLSARTGTIAAALRFTGAGLGPGPAWTTPAGGLGVLRVAP